VRRIRRREKKESFGVERKSIRGEGGEEEELPWKIRHKMLHHLSRLFVSCLLKLGF